MIETHVREDAGGWKVVLVLIGTNKFSAANLTVQEARDIVHAAAALPTGFTGSKVYSTPRWGAHNELVGVDVWLDRVQVDDADIERLRRMLAAAIPETPTSTGTTTP